MPIRLGSKRRSYSQLPQEEEDPVNEVELASSADLLALRVMAPPHILKPVTVRMRKDATIDTLRAYLSSTTLKKYMKEGERLRIITSGRMLGEGPKTLLECGLADGAFLHVAISQPPSARSRRGSMCSSNGENADVEDHLANQDPSTWRGFDSLRRVGFTSHDIAALRSTFRDAVREYTEQHADDDDAPEGETEGERELRMETAWMREQGANSEFALNVVQVQVSSQNAGSTGGDVDSESSLADGGEGAISDLVCGTLLGLVMGPLMLLFIWERSLTRKLKLGILLGVLLQFFLSYGSLSSGNQKAKHHIQTGGTANSIPNTADANNGNTGDVSDPAIGPIDIPTPSSPYRIVSGYWNGA